MNEQRVDEQRVDEPWVDEQWVNDHRYARALSARSALSFQNIKYPQEAIRLNMRKAALPGTSLNPFGIPACDS